jgi:hypothetical protein
VVRPVRLTREVVARDGPSRRQAVEAYRKRRRAVERGERFLASARAHLEHAEDMDAADVVDEIFLLTKALKETL